jgi:hypothetical protein
MKEKIENPASEILDQGLKNYEQALRMGLNVQEEAGKWWSRLLSQAVSLQDLQKRIASLTNDAIPATQKSLESYLKVLEQSSAASVELIKKGMEAAQTANYADAQSKVVEFCENSLKSLRANTQAVVDINTKAVDSWFAFVKKASIEEVEPRAAKAQA